jgi:hypothetical protein
MIKALLLIVLALASGAAQAHDCDPLATNAGVQVGTARRTVSTAAGTADVWWCSYTNASTPAGMVNWRMQRIVDLAECRSLATLAAGAARVVASPTYATFVAELRAAMDACIVQEATARHYEVQRLAWLGCRELVANPPAGTSPTWLKPADAPATWVPADWCGAAPVAPAPPPPPPGVYAVNATAAFPLRADGTRSLTRWPAPATVGEPCDCAVQIPNPFGGRYCKVPRLSTTAQTVVAGCTAKP